MTPPSTVNLDLISQLARDRHRELIEAAAEHRLARAARDRKRRRRDR